MDDNTRKRLRQTFGEVASVYRDVRPLYPAQAFHDLISFVSCATGFRILEIGCGTGQATLPLATTDATIVAVELNEDMASIARTELANFSSVTIEVSAFEDWLLPDAHFDLAFCATSFHWLDPETRLVKIANALRPLGFFAVLTTHHIAGGTVEFFADMLDCYERFGPAELTKLRLPAPQYLDLDPYRFKDVEAFDMVFSNSYEWEVEYATESYLNLLTTYSDHRALPKDDLDNLLECLGNLIDRKYQGRISKRYLAHLVIMRRSC